MFLVPMFVAGVGLVGYGVYGLIDIAQQLAKLVQ
jgi:hypothetical protein